MRRGAVAITTALLPSLRHVTYRCSSCKALPPRLQHVFDLVASCDDVFAVADIGTDHGWLASALAKQFQHVVGVDKSEQALQDGALARDEKYQNLHFRVGNGLEKLLPGKLMPFASQEWKLETLDTRHLILQPTNSRPRHLMMLYDFVRHHGWSVEDEYILSTQRRWYITTRFDKTHQHSSKSRNLLPGSILSNKASMRPIFTGYMEHHIQWIEQDRRPTGEISDEDKRWLEMLSPQ